MKVSLAKYNKKRKQTLSKRNCGFELTYEEFKTLYQKATVCDYTGQQFSKTEPSLFPSLERVDKKLPYRRDNCIIVCAIANQIKDVVEEGTGRVRIEHQKILEKIQKVLSENTREDLVSKYFPKVDNIRREVKNKMSDLEIAKMYIKDCEKESNFQVTFSKYKSKITRKTCEVTGKVFDKQNDYTSPALCKIDQDAPWTDNNIQVVCKMVRNIKVNKLFTNKEISKINS